MTSRLERIRKLMDAPPEAPMLDEILRGFEVYLRLKMRQARQKQGKPADPYRALRIHLLQAGLTQRELAEKLNVHRVYLCRVLTGARAGYRLRNRLVREFGFPEWLLDPIPRRGKASA